MGAVLRWFPEVVDDLRARVLSGQDPYNISQEMGFTLGAIQKMMWKLQIFSPDNDGEEEQFADMAAIGTANLLYLMQKHHPEGDPYAE